MKAVSLPCHRSQSEKQRSENVLWMWMHFECEHLRIVPDTSIWQAASVSAVSALQYLVCKFFCPLWVPAEQLDCTRVLRGIWDASAFQVGSEVGFGMNLLVIPTYGALVCKNVCSLKVDTWDSSWVKLNCDPGPKMLQQLMDVQPTLELIGNNSPYTVCTVNIRSSTHTALFCRPLPIVLH